MSSSSDSDIPRMGDTLYYYDENRQPFAAIVSHVYAKTKAKGRPICSLAIFKRNGRVAARSEIEPAYHDGVKWVLLNKWSWPDEVPETEWNYLPPPSLTSHDK